MSAYLLEVKGFNQLADQLYAYASGVLRANNGYGFVTLKFLGIDDYLKNTDKNIKSAIQRRINNLMSANNHAVEQRYGNTEEYEYIDINPICRSHWAPLQLIKNLHCLRYQLSEGDVPDSEIYKLLDRFTKELSEAYISRLPEYNKAKWGW